MERRAVPLIVSALVIVLAVAYHYTGWIGTAILGGSAVPAFLFWHKYFVRCHVSPSVTVPVFAATIAAFQIHSIEEFYGHYGPAIGRLFDFGWTDQRFVIAICLLSAALSLVIVGLYYRLPVARFLVSLFLVTRFAEVLLLVFPLVRPAVHPEVHHAISAVVTSGTFVSDMQTYWVPATGHYYFPGLFTLPLVISVAGFALWRISKAALPHSKIASGVFDNE
ncbi:MAG TPA: hypothetical protein VFA99_07630 [Acidobacteriaceae bacterium]|nr:hypothetical protein [Acidobacteriaceae bacterium]